MYISTYFKKGNSMKKMVYVVCGITALAYLEAKNKSSIYGETLEHTINFELINSSKNPLTIVKMPGLKSNIYVTDTKKIIQDGPFNPSKPLVLQPGQTVAGQYPSRTELTIGNPSRVTEQETYYINKTDETRYISYDDSKAKGTRVSPQKAGFFGTTTKTGLPLDNNVDQSEILYSR